MSEGTPGTVTLSIEAHDELRGKLKTAYEEMAALRAQLTEAQLSSGEEHLGMVIDTLEQAIPVIQFAVGNLHPTTVKGWPHRELRGFANGLELLPGATPAQKELAQDLRVFAAEAEATTEARELRERREREDLRRLRERWESRPENLTKTKAELIAEFATLTGEQRAELRDKLLTEEIQNASEVE